jgi:hypothetical protein
MALEDPRMNSLPCAQTMPPRVARMPRTSKYKSALPSAPPTADDSLTVFVFESRQCRFFGTDSSPNGKAPRVSWAI